ncbi:hypothetical protein ACFUOZ_21325, partial [Paenarthrobacter sp. NPDC057355]|uniref:hypothetical protein n=1 Tax=Paenarthrobacter sp. NPDC057355 TaxID=3346105 RepID=UPI00362A30EA
MGTPMFDEVLGSDRFAEVHSRGEGPRIGGGGTRLPVNELLTVAMILQVFSEDSSVLDKAMALLSPVPVVNSVLWIASAAVHGDGSGVAAGSLALASGVIEAGLGLAGWFGVEAGALMAALSTTAAVLGIASLIVVGVSMFVSLVQAHGWMWVLERSNPLLWFISTYINPITPEQGKVKVPELGDRSGAGMLAWTPEYVKARVVNAQQLWAEKFAESHTYRLFEGLQPGFERGQKSILYNAFIAQGAAERVGAANGDFPADVEKVKAGIRDRAAQSLQALRAGMIKGVKDNFATMVTNMNKGRVYEEFQNEFIATTLLPEFKEAQKNQCDHRMWVDRQGNQCRPEYWTVETFKSSLHLGGQSSNPVSLASMEALGDIDLILQGRGHGPANGPAQEAKKAVDDGAGKVGNDKPEAEVLPHVKEAGRLLEKTVGALPLNKIHAPEVKNAYTALGKWKDILDNGKLDSSSAVKALTNEATTAFTALATLAAQTPPAPFVPSAVPASKTITTTGLAWSFESPVSSTPEKNTGTPTNGRFELINGFGPAGHNVSIKDQNGATVCTTTVTALGIWACKPANPTKPGHITTLSLTTGTTDTGTKIT